MLRVIVSVFYFYGLSTSASAQGPFVQEPFERGLASWYGEPYHGQKAASGEIYDKEQLTAAHRTLPFGTSVRVRRLDGNKSVVVRVNDRGPYVESRIIDLSQAAATKLGMTHLGVLPVILEVLDGPPRRLDATLRVSATSENCSVR
jgi:rare lipoprotein A